MVIDRPASEIIAEPGRGSVLLGVECSLAGQTHIPKGAILDDPSPDPRRGKLQIIDLLMVWPAFGYSNPASAALWTTLRCVTFNALVGLKSRLAETLLTSQTLADGRAGADVDLFTLV